MRITGDRGCKTGGGAEYEEGEEPEYARTGYGVEDHGVFFFFL